MRGHDGLMEVISSGHNSLLSGLEKWVTEDEKYQLSNWDSGGKKIIQNSRWHRVQVYRI